MRILNETQQINAQGEKIEAAINDLQKLYFDYQDQILEAKAFYFFNGHKIESLILKRNAVYESIKILKEYLNLIDVYKKIAK
jgi:hypothetical protein